MYCKYNYTDYYCNKLRINKCQEDKKKNKQNLIKSEKKIIKDCKSCESKVDLSKYIKKDQIPCWGCNLDKIDNI